MKVLALIAALLFAGVVSADNHTGTPAAGHGDAAHAEKKDDKAATKDAKAPAAGTEVKKGKK
ncbi:MAG: hypothetical protein K2X47_17280 [Bdellovibrionales bacterium]|nr:hypothetical protein [Bdellovibrionales bacterium]